MSQSKSQSQANQTTSNVAKDQRIAADGNAIALAEGATLIQDTVSDDIAIAAIRETGDTAARGFDFAEGVNRDSLDFGSRIIDTAGGLLSEQLAANESNQRTVAQLAEGLSTLAVTNLEKNKRDPDSDVIQEVAKYAAIGVGVVAVAVVLTRSKK